MKKFNFTYIFIGIVVLNVLSDSIFSDDFSIGSIAPFFIVIAVGLLFVSASKKTKQSKSYKKASSGAKKSCPQCLKLIPVEAEICPSCGANTNKTVVCDYCGALNPEGILQCEKCKGLL